MNLKLIFLTSWELLKKLKYDTDILGYKTGFKYWKLRVKSLFDRNLPLVWADNCDKESNRLALLGRHTESEGFAKWAQELRKNYSENS